MEKWTENHVTVFITSMALGQNTADIAALLGKAAVDGKELSLYTSVEGVMKYVDVPQDTAHLILKARVEAGGDVLP